MKDGFIIIICSLLVTFEIKAQVTYNILIDHENQPEWGYSLLNENDTFILSGTTNILIDSFYRDGIFIRKFDIYGNIMVEKFYAGVCSSYDVGNPGNLSSWESGYWTVGTRQFCDNSFPDEIGSEGLLYKFNHLGDTIWTKALKGKGFSIIHKGVISAENNYLIAGLTHDTVDTHQEFYIIKTDSSGEIIWEKIFSYYILNWAFSVDSYSNGNIIVGGLVDPTTALNEGDGILIKLNSSGEIIWEKKIGTPDDDAGILVRISNDEKNLFIRQSIDTIINEGDEVEPDYIGKLDNDGNFIWRTFFNGPYKQDIWGIREMDNKSIVAVGIKDVDDEGDGRGFICKLDSNGTVLWERTYYSRIDRDNYFTDVARVSDGGLILTGSAWSDTEQDVWLVRLDSMGCLEPGCDETDVVDPQAKADDLFTIYPNPVYDISTVEIHIPDDFLIVAGATLQINVFDINGKIVDEYSNIPVDNPGEIIRFCFYKNNLSKGFYNAQLMYAGKRLGNLEIVMY